MKKVLVIYTGGTFGMQTNAEGVLVPCPLVSLVDSIDEIKQLNISVTECSFSKPLDSSSITPYYWTEIGIIVDENYSQYDGFVVLHGTDTMAYTASALSFMFQGLQKPIVFTGAQLPIGKVRNDARRNLVSALQVASDYDENGKAKVREVCICFNDKVIRANRAKKLESSQFDAFHSENYPIIASIGVSIEYSWYCNRFIEETKYDFHANMNASVNLLYLTPGISKDVVERIVDKDIADGVVLVSYGAGNVGTFNWLIEILKEYITQGGVVLNVSQCLEGQVQHGVYGASNELNNIGVISGGDITLEGAYAKMKFVLGNTKEPEQSLKRNLTGEILSN